MRLRCLSGKGIALFVFISLALNMVLLHGVAIAGTADEDFAFAVRLYQKEELELAIEEFEKFVKQHRDDERIPEALIVLGDCYFRLKRYEQALKAFQSAAKEASVRGRADVEARATYWVGESYYQMRKYDEAINWYEMVLKKFPKGVEAPYALYSLGLAMRELGKKEEALSYFKRCVEAFPESDVAPQCQWLIGECLLDLKRYEEAKRAYEEVLKRYPKSKEVADALLGLGWVSFEQGNYEEAAKLFNDVARHHPDTQAGKEAVVREADCYFNLKRYEQALELYRKVADSRENPFADHAIYWSGQCLLRMKQPQAAATQFLLLIRAMPNSPYVARAYSALGEAYMAMERFQEAEEAFKVALKHVKEQKEASLITATLADCLLKQGKFDEASKLVVELLKGMPEDKNIKALVATLMRQLAQVGDINMLAKLIEGVKPTEEVLEEVALALFERGKKAYENKDYETAERIYKLLLERFQKTSVTSAVLFALGAVHYVRERYGDAEAIYAELLKRFPDDKFAPEAHYWRANSLWMLKRFAEAHDEFSAFIKSGSKDEAKIVTALYRDGLCLYELKRFEEAISRFELLLKEHPNSELCDDALYQLSWVYIDADKRDSAMNALKRLIEQHKQSRYVPEAHFLIGELLLMRKQADEAVAHYEECIKLSSGKDEELCGKAYYRYGWALLTLKRKAEALKAFEEALKRQLPDDVKADAILQVGYLQFNERKFNEALSSFERLLKEHPQSPLSKFALLYKGKCLNELNKFAEAEAVLQQLIEKYPNEAFIPSAKFELAWAKQNRKQYDTAIELYKSVASSEGAGELAVEAQFRVGECMLSKGDTKEALREFLRVALLYEDLPEWAAASHFYAGLCYEQLGENEKAEKAYRTVLEKYPQTKWAEKAKECLKKLNR